MSTQDAVRAIDADWAPPLKITWHEFTDPAVGTVHVACFMSWCGVAYGYRLEAARGMCPWEPQPVWAPGLSGGTPTPKGLQS